MNKEHSFEIDSAASSGDHAKIMTYVGFPQPSLGAGLSFFDFSLLVIRIFRKELIKIKKNHNLY